MLWPVTKSVTAAAVAAAAAVVGGWSEQVWECMGVGRCVTRCPGERGLPTATASTQQDMTRLQWTNRQGLFAYITPCLLLLLLLGPRVECQRLREDLCYCYCNATGAMRSPDGFPTVEGQVTKSTGRPSSPPDVGPTHGTPGGIPRNPFAVSSATLPPPPKSIQGTFSDKRRATMGM